MDASRKLKGAVDCVLEGRVVRKPKGPTHAGAHSQPRKSTMERWGLIHPENTSSVFIKQENDTDSVSASATNTLASGGSLISALEPRQNIDPYSELGDAYNDIPDMELANEDTQHDFDDDRHPTTNLPPGSDSDEPIPSIEADEGDFLPSEPIAMPYLHGTAKIKKNVRSLHVGYLDETHFEQDDDDDDDENRNGNGNHSEEEGDQYQIQDGVDFDFTGLEENLIEESEGSLLIAEEDLRNYVKHKLTLEGISTWPKEAARLYKLLYLRGLYPLMPSSWTWDFFGHPVPGGIFAPKYSDDKSLIKAYGNRIRAARAMVDLFKLYSRVRALRQTSHNERIGPIIKGAINTYLHWASEDAGLRRIGYEIGFAWPVFVLDFSRASDAERIMRGCQRCVRRYKAKWVDLGIENYPRLITVFAIIQHIVVVLVVDTCENDAQEPMPMTEIDVSELNHWLDTAIAIAIPITLARESLLPYRHSFPITESEEADPDL